MPEVEKRRGGKRATASMRREHSMPSPARTENAVSRKEIGEHVASLDKGVNRAGIVPAGGGPRAVDQRRRMYLGKQRLGKRWTEIITAVNDGVFTWDEFVETLDASEIARGQLKDKEGKFRGRPPAYVPRGFFDACQKVLMKRGRQEWEKAYLLALQTLTDIAVGKEPGAKVSDKIKAAQLVVERMEGKTPERVEIKMSDPFQDMVAGVVAEVNEEAAIAAATDYYERMAGDDGDGG